MSIMVGQSWRPPEPEMIDSTVARGREHRVLVINREHEATGRWRGMLLADKTFDAEECDL